MFNRNNTFLGALKQCAVILFAVVYTQGALAQSAQKGWVGTWGTARQLVEPNNMPPAPGLTNNTIRQVVAVSIGGSKIRLKFSNEFSKTPTTLKTVQIAISKGGSAIDEATTKTLKFDGKEEVTLAPGVEITSDAIAFKLQPRTEVAITIAYGETSQTVTGHPGSRTTSYILTGNQTVANTDYAAAVKTDHWYNITGIDVENTSKNAGAVATFGDSITDGRGSGTNKQNRWPDILAMELLGNKATQNVGVLNMGIGGNAVLRGGLGPYALSRFEHDVLNQAGIKWVIIYEGVNDLGNKRDSTVAYKIAADLITAYEKMITDAHAKGIKVYGATITPFKGNGYYSVHAEGARQKVNEWIRKSGKFDALIDFDKTVRDPANPEALLDAAQSGANDHLHPNEQGYVMMGKSIDLKLFK
ncbi:SGNH/GDSL hydrolase family protein [Mucilaginibacter calamicampi]|uniref:SGNH/GDSL hydrolase family protein n=1 Tax=Mucilaginibacter calamicampi TaxID=1302352 RepID=A0ABW2YWU9_9SPHI